MTDSATPHFDISAAVVRQLGEELVSDEVTAIVELVKNAYDADATFANVVVNTEDALPLSCSAFPDVKGYITVEDDGVGMNRSDIIDGWLMISLSAKRKMKSEGRKTPKGRTPLGDKGLGRLSTQKLGDNLEMLTTKDGGCLHVAFSWSSFGDDRSLSEVPVSINDASKDLRKRGTLLAVSGLRNPNAWRGSAVEQLVADLSQIISPYPEARPFLVTLKINGRPMDLGHVSEKLRNAAVSRFEFAFKDRKLKIGGKIRLAKLRGNDGEFYDKSISRDNGRAFFDFLKNKTLPVPLQYSVDRSFFVTFDYEIDLASLGDIEMVPSPETADKEEPADPGPFKGEIDEFMLRFDEAGWKLGGLINANEVQQLVRLQAGIKVFRDGFGIKPYGVNGQDWLRLGVQQTSGSSWYGLRPQNVLGFVLISEAENGKLKEKTDREGFVSNPWSINFQRLVMHVAETVGGLYEAIRRNLNLYKAELAEKEHPFRGSQQTLTDATDVAQRLAHYTSRTSALKTDASTARQKIEKVTARIKQTPILSSGTERELEDLLTEAEESLAASGRLFAELETYSDQAKGLADIVKVLVPKLDLMAEQLQDFSELAGLGLLAENLSHEVQNQTDRLMSRASGAISRGRASRPENAPLVQFAQEVISTVSVLRKIVGHLTPSLRFQRDKIERFDISDLIRDVKEHFVSRWEGDKFTCKLAVSGSDFSLETNQGRIIQVLDNLILNAEYWLKNRAKRPGAEEPVIFIDYEPNRIRVWDNGSGIDKSIEDTLFEPFVTLKPKAQGRGLGLYINAQIMDSLGGSINLLSDRNDAGKRYIFEIDLASVARD